MIYIKGLKELLIYLTVKNTNKHNKCNFVKDIAHQLAYYLKVV